jgi:hypothetical protein
VTPPERPWGDDPGTTGPAHACPLCAASFIPVGRQRYCSDACRKRAWKRARHDPRRQARATIALAPRRRATTVYECPDCEERYLGEQWCPSCNRPCRRVGVGGLCPACDHPVAVDDLIAQHQDDLTHTPKIR